MRVYFHLVGEDGKVLDDTGIEVPDVAVAEREALVAIQELRQEVDHSDEEWRGWWLEAVDSRGRILFCMPLDAAIH
jgi:hypothetical protein